MRDHKQSIQSLIGIFAGLLSLIAVCLCAATNLRGLPYDATLIAGAALTIWFVLWHITSRRPAQRRAEASAHESAERAVLQRAMKGLDEHMRAIVATATEGIITIDRAGRIETFNGAAERLFGHRADDVIGRNVALLMPEPHHSEHDAYLDRYQSSGQARIIGIGREVEGLRKDGTTFPIHLSVGEGVADGKRFFTAIARDITYQKDMQAKLTQAERLAAIGELSAGVAHEINNPINTVINCAQLIKDGDDAMTNCDVIISEGQRIAAIVKDLLQFARDDRDRPQSTSLPDAVARTLRLVGENLKRHGIRLTLDVPDDLPPVHARPQQLQQVLLNLLINARDALLQAATDPREVRLSAASDERGVALIVRDNGPGIPAHLGNRIFEPFVTTKRARGGTGLGLSISKSIVEGYGGRLDVRSGPGAGAEFAVWLPHPPEGEE